MRIWPWRRTEQRQAGGGGTYTDAIVQAILATSTGGSADKAVPAVTAALETCAALYAAAFGAARVVGTSLVNPVMLSAIGRELIINGESLYLLDAGAGMGNAALLHADTWDITGGYRPDTWRYHVTIPAPSGTGLVRYARADEVVHAMYSHSSARPWVGVSPLGWASGTGSLLAIVEKVLRDESGGTRGYVLPLPAGGDDDEVDELKADLRQLGGRTAVVETTSAGWGAGGSGAPAADWRPRRIGPDFPRPVVELRTAAQNAVVSACGVPLGLVGDRDAAGLRESWRIFLHGSVAPLARRVEHELSMKLETPVRLDFTELYAADVQGRARAFQSMTGGGLAPERAARLAGLAD